MLVWSSRLLIGFIRLNQLVTECPNKATFLFFVHFSFCTAHCFVNPYIRFRDFSMFWNFFHLWASIVKNEYFYFFLGRHFVALSPLLQCKVCFIHIVDPSSAIASRARAIRQLSILCQSILYPFRHIKYLFSFPAYKSCRLEIILQMDLLWIIYDILMSRGLWVLAEHCWGPRIAVVASLSVSLLANASLVAFSIFGHHLLLKVERM